LYSYTHALEVAVVEEAVYYSNRAACKSPRLINLILIRALTSEKIHGTDYLHVRFYTAGWQNMTPPRYEQVLDDCDKALKLDPA
jgi:hypothetical protein